SQSAGPIATRRIELVVLQRVRSTRRASSSPALTCEGTRGPALRIVLFALNGRRAVILVDMRKARAISSIVRPKTMCSVKATRSPLLSAGSQSLNINDSRSSSTARSGPRTTNSLQLVHAPQDDLHRFLLVGRTIGGALHV